MRLKHTTRPALLLFLSCPTINASKFHKTDKVWEFVGDNLVSNDGTIRPLGSTNCILKKDVGRKIKYKNRDELVISDCSETIETSQWKLLDHENSDTFQIASVGSLGKVELPEVFNGFKKEEVRGEVEARGEFEVKSEVVDGGKDFFKTISDNHENVYSDKGILIENPVENSYFQASEIKNSEKLEKSEKPEHQADILIKAPDSLIQGSIQKQDFIPIESLISDSVSLQDIMIKLAKSSTKVERQKVRAEVKAVRQALKTDRKTKNEHHRHKRSVEQSKNVFNENALCWSVRDPASDLTQKLELHVCDSLEGNQRFEYNQGRIHFAGNENMCLGTEFSQKGESAVYLSKCFWSAWGEIESDNLETSYGKFSQYISKIPVTDYDFSILQDSHHKICVHAKSEANSLLQAGSCENGKPAVLKYDSETQQIISTKLDVEENEVVYPYCWSVEEETNRLKLSHCDWDELGQKFVMMSKMDEENGSGAAHLIILAGSMSQSDNPLCVGVEYSSDCDSGDGISDYDVSDSGNSCLHATGHLVATTCMLNLFGGERPQLNFRGQCKSFSKKGVAKCGTCAEYDPTLCDSCNDPHATTDPENQQQFVSSTASHTTHRRKRSLLKKAYDGKCRCMKGFKDDNEGICVQKSCLNLNVFEDTDQFSHTKKCTHCDSATNECTRCANECALVNSEGNCGCAGEIYENGGCKWADAAMSILCPQPVVVDEASLEVGGVEFLRVKSEGAEGLVELEFVDQSNAEVLQKNAENTTKSSATTTVSSVSTSSSTIVDKTEATTESTTIAATVAATEATTGTTTVSSTTTASSKAATTQKNYSQITRKHHPRKRVINPISKSQNSPVNLSFNDDFYPILTSVRKSQPKK